MKHLFLATKIGWAKEQEGIWFDSYQYTREEAEAQIKPYQSIDQRGFPYTGYEYDGEKYYDYKYLGEFPDNEMPKNDHELWNYLLQKEK